MPTDALTYTTILIELHKAVKMRNFYPQGHPNLDAAFGKAYTLLKNQLDESGDIKWRVDQKGFYFDKAPIAPGNEPLAGLAKKLFFRRIKEITITPAATPADIKKFLTILDMEPEPFLEKGGIEVFVAENDITGILLNEMRYEDLAKLKNELEEKRQKDEKRDIAADKQGGGDKQGEGDEQGDGDKQGEGDKEGKKEEPTGASASDAEKGAPLTGEKKPSPEAEELNALIEKIRGEKDFLRYKDLAVRIKETADKLTFEKRFDEVFPALVLFEGHSSPFSGLSDEIRYIAEEALKYFLTPEALQRLAARAGVTDEAERAAVQQILLHGGGAAIEALLTALVDAPEASTRRILFNVALPFGGAVIPYAVKKLDSDLWYVVRQMVTLLGEIGDPESVEHLKAAYGNPDIRVKKEVLKNLARIRSKESLDVLIKALEEEDMPLVTQAIISIGMLRDPAAIDTVGNIALKGGAFSENQEPRKAAIRALRLIGGQQAVPYLTKLLFKKAWLGKKANDDIRCLAAAALGEIGGDEAYAAVEKACGESAGDLYSACKRILDSRDRKKAS